MPIRGISFPGDLLANDASRWSRRGHGIPEVAARRSQHARRTRVEFVGQGWAFTAPGPSTELITEFKAVQDAAHRELHSSREADSGDLGVEEQLVARQPRPGTCATRMGSARRSNGETGAAGSALPACRLMAQNTAGEAQPGTLWRVHAGHTLRESPGMGVAARCGAFRRDRRRVGRICPGQVDVRQPWPPFSGRAAAIALRLVAGLAPEPRRSDLARICHWRAGLKWEALERPQSRDRPYEAGDGKGVLCELPGALRIHFRTRRRTSSAPKRFDAPERFDALGALWLRRRGRSDR
jgi:hypothetical protein